MQSISEAIMIPYNDMFGHVFAAINMTGDSGRSSDVISSRPRRAIPPELATDIQSSPTYADIAKRLGYQSEPV